MSVDSSLACRVCRALIDCPKQEVEEFVGAIGEHLFRNSSAISALDLCYPCLQNARNKPKPPIQGITFSTPVDYNTYTMTAV